MKRALATMFAAAAITVSAVAQETAEEAGRFEAQPQWSATTTLWQSGNYSYDGAGHVMDIDNDRYRYDQYGRLNHATAKTTGNTANLQTFTYDRYGNLATTDITTPNGTSKEGYAVDANTNQLDGTCTSAPTICYSALYDAAGRQLGRYNTTEYQWDPLGMLKEVNSMRHEQYLYDAADERVVVIHYTGSTEISRRYTLRGADNKVAREMTFNTSSATWSVTKDYVHRSGGLLASFSGTAATPDRHYHVDHLGSTRLVTDGAGYKVAIHTYWPFGREADGSELDNERLKFTGHERDSSGGTPGFDLDYMHARYYDPNQKRFLSIDRTMSSADWNRPQTWNRYTYVENNPVLLVDPDGEAAWVGALLGASISVTAESIRQVRSGNPVDNDRLKAALIGGAVSGFTGGLAGKAIKSAIVYGAAGGALGGAVQKLMNGENVTARGAVVDGIAGAAGAAIGNVAGRALNAISNNSGKLNELTWKAAVQRAESQAANTGLGADKETVKQADKVIQGLNGAGSATGKIAKLPIHSRVEAAMDVCLGKDAKCDGGLTKPDNK